MNEKDQEAKVETQSETGVTAREVAQEARRKAEEAKRAALQAKKEAQLAAKKVKKAKKAEARATRQNERIVRQKRKRRTMVDQGVEQAEVDLTKGVELAAAEGTDKEAREAKEQGKRENEKTREADLHAEAAAKETEVVEVSTQLYEGTINIVLMPPAGVLEIKNLEEKLRLIRNLRVILTSGSVDEPARIVVSAEQPILLIDVLSQMAVVDQVTKKGKEIQVLLKAVTQQTIF